MHSFALLVNPVTRAQLRALWPPARFLPGPLSRYFSRHLRSLRVIHLPPVTSRKGNRVAGDLIVWPLLHQDMHALDETVVLEKIVEAGREAKKRGARILGLCGYNSLVAAHATELAKKISIPLTSGETFTAWSVIESLYRIAKLHKNDLTKARIAFVGATHPVAMLCAKKLGPQVAGLILADESVASLSRLQETLIKCGCSSVETAGSAPEMTARLANADFIVVMPHSRYDLVGEVAFTRECFIANLSEMALFDAVPSGVTVFTPGVIKLSSEEFDLGMGLPKNQIYACMAEAMLLALEGKFVPYSFGEQINPDRLEDIADRAVQHGFEVWLPEAPVI